MTDVLDSKQAGERKPWFLKGNYAPVSNAVSYTHLTLPTKA